MSSRIRLASALSAVALAGALVGALAACAAPAPSSSPSPSAAPVGTGDFVPDNAWFEALDTADDGLAEYVGWWLMQECTYKKVVEGDFNCTIHLSGIQEQVVAVDAQLVDVADVAPEAADLVEGLQDAAAVSAEAAAAAKAFSDSGCDLSPGDSCTEGAEQLVDLGGQVQEALAGWEPPAR